MVNKFPIKQFYAKKFYSTNQLNYTFLEANVKLNAFASTYCQEAPNKEVQACAIRLGYSLALALLEVYMCHLPQHSLERKVLCTF